MPPINLPPINVAAVNANPPPQQPPPGNGAPPGLYPWDPGFVPPPASCCSCGRWET